MHIGMYALTIYVLEYVLTTHFFTPYWNIYCMLIFTLHVGIYVLNPYHKKSPARKL